MASFEKDKAQYAIKRVDKSFLYEISTKRTALCSFSVPCYRNDMAKRPKDLPEIGDRVSMKYRGEKIFGVIEQVNTSNDWTCVKWDRIGPVVCHLFELRKASDNHFPK